MPWPSTIEMSGDLHSYQCVCTHSYQHCLKSEGTKRKITGVLDYEVIEISLFVLSCRINNLLLNNNFD